MRKDLTGQRFGLWTVLDRAINNKHGQSMWRCVCECEQERIVSQANLITGKSNGCQQCRSGRVCHGVEDITGRQFGSWTVIKRAEGCDAVECAAKWLCRCSCGVENVVLGRSMKRGISKSCKGCSNVIDITGRRFGRWLVLGRAPRIDRRTRWRCRCDCGNESVVIGGTLKQGTSSGCTACGAANKPASVGELIIAKFLTDNDINHEPEWYHPNCKHVNVLRFDFLVHPNILIEYDGEQHYSSVEGWGGKPTLLRTQKNDAIKTAWARDNNYTLIRIPYWDRDRIQEILTDQLGVQQIKSEQAAA